MIKETIKDFFIDFSLSALVVVLYLVLATILAAVLGGDFLDTLLAVTFGMSSYLLARHVRKG